MLKFVVITYEELIIKTLPNADFLDFVEDTVGVHFGHRRHDNMVVIENNLLEELNPLATKLLGSAFFDTVVVINKQNDEYQALSEEQIKDLYEKLSK